AFLVAAEEERGAAMRAVHGEKPDLATRVAEGDEILAEEAHLLGWAIRRGELARGEAGHPVFPQERAHGRAGSHPTQAIAVFAREHPAPSLGRSSRARGAHPPSPYPLPPGRERGCVLHCQTAKAIPPPDPASERYDGT